MTLVRRLITLIATVLFPAVAYSQGSSARLSKTDAFNCGVIDIVLLSDRAFGKDEASTTAIRNELLGYVDAAQAYFQNFDTQINFRVKEVFIPTDENPFPRNNDNVKALADVNEHMKAWLLSKGYDDRSFDLRIAIMDFNYRSGPENYAGYFYGEPFSMGSAMVKKQSTRNQTIALLVHELGHAFGAGHDPNDGATIMSPNALAAGGTWSEDSKAAINKQLKSKEMVEWVGPCQRFGFDGTESNTNVHLTWNTNFEINVSRFILYADTTAIAVIPAKGSPTSEAVYEYTVENALPGYKVYALEQISRFDQKIDRRTVVIGEKIEGLRAWPNPFADTLRVIGSEEARKIIVYNAQGSQVMELQGAASMWLFETSEWASGLYFIRRGKETIRVVKR